MGQENRLQCAYRPGSAGGWQTPGGASGLSAGVGPLVRVAAVAGHAVPVALLAGARQIVMSPPCQASSKTRTNAGTPGATMPWLAQEESASAVGRAAAARWAGRGGAVVAVLRYGVRSALRGRAAERKDAPCARPVTATRRARCR